MPTMQAMTSRANTTFGLGAQGIGAIDPSALAPGIDLPELATKLGIAMTEPEREFLAAFPPGLLEALRAVLYSAVQRRLAVTFAWAPGYAHEISFWDVADTSQTKGGVTVFIRTPLPPV